MTAILRPLAIVLTLAIPAQALAARSAWVNTERSQMRLLLTEAPGAPLLGGVEIVLEPGWHTYWRNPGEAGIPPVFDFSGSENVAGVEVRYPAPQRYDDGASISLVYEDEVVFPIEVTPIDPESPVTLSVAALFGVCREICIPTRAKAEVTSGGDASDPLSEDRIGRFRSRLPGAPDPGRFDIESVRADADGLVVEVRAPDSSYLDLFADPLSGFSLGQPRAVSREGDLSRYRIAVLGGQGWPLRGEKVRFVAVSGGEAVEEVLEVR